MEGGGVCDGKKRNQGCKVNVGFDAQQCTISGSHATATVISTTGTTTVSTCTLAHLTAEIIPSM